MLVRFTVKLSAFREKQNSNDANGKECWEEIFLFYFRTVYFILTLLIYRVLNCGYLNERDLGVAKAIGNLSFRVFFLTFYVTQCENLIHLSWIETLP